MKLETKFDKDQKVWFSKQDLIQDDHPCKCPTCGTVVRNSHWGPMCPSGPHTITVITLHVNTGTMEFLCDDAWYKGEDELYGSEAEAQAECDRRNREA